ncbi:S-layer homology domain-containing protein [Chungangia koreensis]|uniref:S-layer homology domain-containing protein n=1 Tax=Chungangia koreensis TaxID=752657 RepID=A0ABV8X3L1_9LACT
MMNRIGNKVVLVGLMVIALFLVSPKAEAKPLDYYGGVANEYEYEEVFFLTGYPINFKGKATVTERESRGTITTTYKFTLSSAAGDKLTRSVVYTTEVDDHADKGQSTSQTSVKSYTEKVTIGKDWTYTLDDYQFSKGVVSDHRPASDYYSGNVIARKIYKVANRATKSEELLTVNLTGRTMGYENFWGATETQIMEHHIVTASGREGFVTSKVSDSKSRVLEYEPNEPDLSSFKGGHAVISTSNMVSEYTYDLQYGSKGKIKLSQEMTPKIERLIVPKFRDLTYSSAREDIEKLYSLGIYDESSQFFSPNTPMTRYQFAVGVLRGVDLRVLEEPKKTATKSIFKDVSIKDPNYRYIQSAVEKGVINGVTPDKFVPDGPITRMQAVAIMMRSLGMEGRAPTPGYKLNFTDNGKIPAWGKDAVYVSTEIGLIQGDRNGRFNPDQPITRAEASIIMVRFLNFLENDLKQNYREDIFFY